MDLNMINGVLRAILPALVAYVVGKGWIPAGSAGDISAAVMALAAAMWSVHTNKPSAVVAAAAANPAVEKIVAPTLVASQPSEKVVSK